MYFIYPSDTFFTSNDTFLFCVYIIKKWQPLFYQVWMRCMRWMVPNVTRAGLKGAAKGAPPRGAAATYHTNHAEPHRTTPNLTAPRGSDPNLMAHIHNSSFSYYQQIRCFRCSVVIHDPEFFRFFELLLECWCLDVIQLFFFLFINVGIFNSKILQGYLFCSMFSKNPFSFYLCN